MKEAWRWFGPQDPVALDHVRQAGATDIVSALHQLKPGAVWTEAAVAERKNLIEKTPPGRKPLYWSVVESIPIPDDVKRLGKGAKQSIEAWIASLQAVAKADIKTVCYNFMPVVDWTRTDLDYELPTGLNITLRELRAAGYFVSIAQRAVNQASINQKNLGKTPIPIPPLSEQRQIVEKVEQLMTLVDALERQLEASRTTGEKLLEAIVSELTAA